MPPTMEPVTEVVDAYPCTQTQPAALLEGKQSYAAGVWQDEHYGFTNEPDADFVEDGDGNEWCYRMDSSMVVTLDTAKGDVAIVDTGCTGCAISREALELYENILKENRDERKVHRRSEKKC